MSFLQKIKHGAAKAADKAQRTVETTKLSAQISRKRKEMKDNFTSMGTVVYQAYRSGNLSSAEPEIARLSEENAVIETAIADIHLKISLLNDEKMCVCGQSAGNEAVFCAACGRKLGTDMGSASLVGEQARETYEVAVAHAENDTPVYEGIEAIRCSLCKDELQLDEPVCPRCGTAQTVTGREA